MADEISIEEMRGLLGEGKAIAALNDTIDITDMQNFLKEGKAQALTSSPEYTTETISPTKALATAVTTAMQGATGGYGEEAASYANALLDNLAARAIGKEPVPVSEGYNRYLSGAREGMRQMREELPVTSFATEVAGSLPLTSVKALTAATKAAPVLTSAGLGALYGFGSGEGGVENRAISAGVGGLLGGTITGAGREIVNTVGKPIVNHLNRKIAFLNAAKDEVADTIKGGIKTIEQKFSKEGQRQAAVEQLAKIAGVTETELRDQLVNFEKEVLAEGARPTLKNYHSTAEALQNPRMAQAQQAAALDNRYVGEVAKINAARDAARKEIIGAASEVVPETISFEGLGGDIKATIGKNAKEARAAASKLYEAVDPEGTSRIPILKEKMAVQDAFSKYFGTEAAQGTLSPEGQRIFDLFTKSDEPGQGVNTKSWRYLQDLKSRISTRLRDKTMGNPERAVLTEVKSQIDNAVERAATTGKGFSPEQQIAWKEASAAWRDMAETFVEPRTLKQVLNKKTYDSEVFDKIWKPGGTKPESVRAVVNALGDNPDVKESIKAAFIAKIPTTKEGNFALSSFKNYVKRNNEALKELFEPEHLERFKVVLNDLETQSEMMRNATGGGPPSLEKLTMLNLLGQSSIEKWKGSMAWRYPQLSKMVRTVLGRVKEIGQKEKEDLVFNALMSPKFAKDLLTPITSENGPGAVVSVIQTLGLDKAAKTVGQVIEKDVPSISMPENLTGPYGGLLGGSVAGSTMGELFGDRAEEPSIFDIEKKNNETSEDGVKASNTALNLIKNSEGLKLTSYEDKNDGDTIGYGHLGTKGKITQEEADRLLGEDVQIAENAINRFVTVPLTQNQFDALTSFVYNVGAGQFKNSTLLKKLNQGRYEEIPAELAKWNRDDGEIVKGLTIRRANEGKLFIA